jgi:hypothetical protein
MHVTLAQRLPSDNAEVSKRGFAFSVGRRPQRRADRTPAHPVTRQPHDIKIADIKIAPQSVHSLGLLWGVQMMKAFARVVLPISLAAAFGLFPRLSCAQDQSFVFYQDPATPVTIQSDRLSASNRNRTATFSGNVVVTQGAVRKRCAMAVVHYHSEGLGRRGVIDRFECKQDYVHLVD